MRCGEPTRYTLWSGAVALGAVLPLVVVAAISERLPWAVLGWLLGAAPGVVCGAGLVRLHGTANAGFLKILGVCMLARLIAYPAGAVLAIGNGRPAVVAYAVGLLAGYLPTQVFEAAWFLRRSSKIVAGLTTAAADQSRGWSPRT